MYKRFPGIAKHFPQQDCNKNVCFVYSDGPLLSLMHH